MLVKVDTTKLENMVIKKLSKAEPDGIFLKCICGCHTLTHQQAIDEIRNESPRGRDIIKALAQGFLRLWVLRGGR